MANGVKYTMVDAISPGWRNRSTSLLKRMLTEVYYQSIHQEIENELKLRESKTSHSY